MPSSSTASTYLERRIFWHFKVSYARLCACCCDSEINIITGWYAGLLERPGEVLQKQVYTDGKVWNEVRDHANRRKRSENVTIIGDMTADVGTVLFRFGRAGDAAAMCELADRVYEWQQKLEREEKQWGRS